MKRVTPITTATSAWVEKCGIQTIDTTIDTLHGRRRRNLYAGQLGTRRTAKSISTRPSSSTAPTASADERNLYVYRNGAPQFVTLLTAASPVVRMQVAPNGQHMAFVTSAPNITGYENQGSKQMYLYEPKPTAARTG